MRPGLIDVHNHIVPARFPVAPQSCTCGRWPHIDPRAEGKAAVVISGRDYRIIDARSWDPARRIADMDEAGVAMQVLSPMPELLSYWLDAETTLAMARHVNEEIARMAATAPRRFAGLGMIPMQAPDLAARELERVLGEHGLLGVEIGSSIDGRSPADPMFDPVYAEAERLGAAIFVHALKPAGMDRLIGPAALQQMIAFPVDVGLAAAAFITGGVLERFPKLRVGFSHGGGALASILPRLAFGWENHDALRTAFSSPRDAARRFFYDSLVYDPPTLRRLIDLVGAERIMAGTDYPYPIQQKRLADWIASCGLSEAETASIRTNTARAFLGV